eukprot:gnl/Hemi2/9319_TR3250_c0_g1_i1.p1 gnl/Hemi2/9319_TR3250_c0_g1~~gnl/Hemi2/9319_TR3250_c0_g1_i1.p1  ORF type:complete len:255 (-),score=26.52 gnl/Hemi2/9319_TR3250_c0_g1_i1:61-825(-)
MDIRKFFGSNSLRASKKEDDAPPIQTVPSVSSGPLPEDTEVFIFPMHRSWKVLLREELLSPQFAALKQQMEEMRVTGSVYPSDLETFNAFTVPLDNVSVVLLAQDPYMFPRQATGYCIASRSAPPSLLSVIREITDDVGACSDHTLLHLPSQGVLMLNSALTVEHGKPGSHLELWQWFTDRVIQKLVAHHSVALLLWGSFAQAKRALLPRGCSSLVLTAAHPSPKSAASGFFGCKHFSKTNDWLLAQGRRPIVW